ncbi:MAG: DUF4492 domain-containing protein [Deltaproteobacteria bacterium RIFOXYD12_FULL_57_12]|nr:MAG: DUF4492 domain-containing protein [Deltaproteobacteria bacterium RIFOXYD12_FULL_57_12]
MGEALPSIWRKIFLLYRDGLRNMRLGRTLWVIILLKLFVIFAILKTFFFPDLLATRFATDAERAGHVLEQLTAMPDR